MVKRWTALLLLAAGCGDDDTANAGSSSSGETASPTTSPSVTTDDVTTVAPTTSTSTADTSGSGSSAGSDSSTETTAPSESSSESTTDTSTTVSTEEGPACVLPDESSSGGDDPPPLDLGVDGGCGNSLIEGDEVCDDGNLEPGDGCEPDCTSSDDVEPEFFLTIGGPNSIPDCGSGVTFDEEGNLYVGGYVLDDVWIRKYDLDYQEVWTVTYPGHVANQCTVTGLAVTSEGDIAFVGATGPFDDADWIFGVLDADGNEIWTQTYGHDAGLNDYPQGLALDSFDNLVMVGVQRPDGVTAEGVVLKYAVDGGVLWSDVFAPGDLSDGAGYGVAIDECDAAIVSGVELNDETTVDAIVRKYDADGELAWQYDAPGGEDYDFAYDVIVDGAGRIVVGGTQSPPGSSYHDWWLARLEADGSELWTSLDGGSGTDEVRGMATRGGGTFWAAGVTGPTMMSTNAWLRRYDVTGAEVWTRTRALPGSSNVWLEIAVSDDGRIAVVGLSQLPFPNDLEAHFAVYPP